MKTAAALALGILLAAAPARAELTVVNAGPRGEVADLTDANEVRVVFSKPMVVLGRVPDPVPAPFFKITPAVAGSFRWSGTDTLLFTPSPALPFATRYEVTIEGAAAADGEKLARPYSFAFTTPTLKLLQTNWYRDKGRFDQPVVLALRFNQPVRGADLLPHLAVRFAPHELKAPAGPEGDAAFGAKVAAARAAAAASEPVAVALAADWDKKQYPAGDDLVVLRTSGVPPPDSWLKLTLAAEARGRQGSRSAGKPQEFTVQLDPTFFVEGTTCKAACDPDQYNPLSLRRPAHVDALRAAVSARDVTDPAKPAALTRAPKPKAEETGEGEGEAGEDYDQRSEVTLDEVGFALKPARTYEVTVAPTLTSADGQPLGYTWTGTVENWHQRAFTSFGTGHGVWESSGGPQLPFYARNLRSVTQWAAPVKAGELVPLLKDLQSKRFQGSPAGAGTSRPLTPKADTIQSFALDLKGVLSDKGTGLVWAALKDGPPIAKAPVAASPEAWSTIVQVTNLGLSVKDSPLGTLVWVTRLSDGQPVEGATVTVRDLDNKAVWSGATGADGIALAPGVGLRNAERWWELAYVVTAEKDADVAYVASDWSDGLEAWSFGVNFDLEEARPLLRGKVFPDRGVYKLGEEVHLKAILRSDTASGMALLAGQTATVVVKDPQGEEVDKRSVTLGEWSSADWAFTLPASGPLGDYWVEATVAGQKRSASGTFLVAAYRRPDFRVDANLAGQNLAGATLTGLISGRYLFGAAMAERDVRWTYSRKRLDVPPGKLADTFPSERWVLADEADEEYHGEESLQTKEEKLDREGQLKLELPTDLANGAPYLYTIEGEVTDLSRQTIAGRATFRVEPAPWTVGFARPSFFVDAKAGLTTQVVAADAAARPVAGVAVKATLTQVQWHSVRRAEGNGFYTWETEKKEVPAGEWDVTTAAQAVPLEVKLPGGGFFILKMTASDADGRSTTASTSFYAVGDGYTAWERYDHNRIDLVPEKKTYRPGETARIMVKSPWEKAKALLTTEREGIRSTKVLDITSTQQTITVPVTENDIPNVFVSLLLVQGRTGDFTPKDASDPGKPAFRLGYVELKVEDAAKRLSVSVKTDKEEYRPATRAKVDVEVKDREGKTGPTEVTLWAVDYGVLSLTGYKTPDVLGSVWAEKALQVMNQDSRLNIISRRAVVPKGGEEGGGGGLDGGESTGVRRDFRVLAFWLGSVVTDAKGKASVSVTLPESLTTYRVMAVAADKASRFGFAEREIRTSKPLLLKSAFPRFLAIGDTARFGAVVHSQLKDKGTAIVTMQSLDPAVVEVVGEPKQTVALASKGSAEARFALKAKAAGTARLQMSVKLQGEMDAFEETFPVKVLSTPEVVAAYGQVPPDGKEAIELPAGVIPSYGGLHLETSSTALVGLGEGARYLVDYPYGCAEQRSSAALALMLAADLGDAFKLPGVEPAKLRSTVKDTLLELESFQCDNGGFGFWKGSCSSVSPYLTSWVTHVLQRGKAMDYAVKPATLEKAYGYLEGELGAEKPANEGWWPAYTAWQAFATKVLAEGGRNVDTPFNRLSQYLDRMPLFALAHLRDAAQAKGEKGKRVEDLDRRLQNGLRVEGRTAFVQELADPYLLWFWNSNVRSTAIALGTLVRGGGEKDELVPRLVTWLMDVRRKGRWGNTQENAWAMEALVDYYRKYEAEVPDFTGVVKLGAETLASPKFQGRSTSTQSKDVPMAQLLGKGQPGEKLDLTFTREGTGTLHYTARLAYAVEAAELGALDQGFKIQRAYTPLKADGSPAGEATTSPAGYSFPAGNLVKVTLTIQVPKERRFVAVTDPLPAGFEPVESWFATTARDLGRQQEEQESQAGDWTAWWKRGGFDHVERHDDRVLLFATRLAAGDHTFSYVVRATTAGQFRTAPTHGEEMYEPEVFGRGKSDAVEVK